MIHINKSTYNKPVSDLNEKFPSGFRTIQFRLLTDDIKFQVISKKILQMKKTEFKLYEKEIMEGILMFEAIMRPVLSLGTLQLVQKVWKKSGKRLDWFILVILNVLNSHDNTKRFLLVNNQKSSLLGLQNNRTFHYALHIVLREIQANF